MLTPEQRNEAIGSMMTFIGKMSRDRDDQLSLVAATLVTACIDFGVPKESMMAAIENIYDAMDDLVTLRRPARLN
jgi:hypothetical protein